MNGKHKGSSYERAICKQLSLWVTNGGNADIFWRSSLSGGRATVAHRKGQTVRQAGDICAVSPEGHQLCDAFFLECKHYRNLDFGNFFIRGAGTLSKFWRVACREAKRHDKAPMMIARQNRYPDVLMVKPGVFTKNRKGLLAKTKDCEVYSLKEVLNGPYDLFRKEQAHAGDN